MKTLKELQDVSIEELNSADRSTLSKWVSKMASAANKRLKRLEQKGMESPAVISVGNSGGKFGARGKNLNQLRSEFIRVKNFLKMKTSTIRGYKKVKKDFFDRVEATTKQRLELTDDFLNKFWRVYDKTANLAPFIKGSEPRQKMVFDLMVDNKNLSEDELLEELNSRFTNFYEEEEDITDEFDTSSFYQVG